MGIDDSGNYDLNLFGYAFITGNPTPPWTGYCWNGAPNANSINGIHPADLAGTHTVTGTAPGIGTFAWIVIFA